MLILDQLKKDDPHLRLMATVVAGGLLILLAGLWWVQVVSSEYYQQKLDVQSQRTVRIPALRGSILDRDGRPLAENRPNYNVDLYLEDLSPKFDAAYLTALRTARQQLAREAADKARQLGRKLTAAEKKQFVVTDALVNELHRTTRFEVSSQIVAEVGVRLQQPVNFTEKVFERRYSESRALPLPILRQLNVTNVARFEEQSMHTPGLELDVQSLRYYPYAGLAAHVLGYVTRNEIATDGELAEYSYRLEDYAGKSGLEQLFDKELRGVAGAKSVLVNNQGYRQSEAVWAPAEPGASLVLTLDLEVQKAAESALQAHGRGAVVVMDAQNGDVLALASAPAYNLNMFVQGLSPADQVREWQHFSDTNSRPQMNRATYENYPPGSIFKIVVALAALEAGVLNPKEMYHSLGYRMVGRRRINDTASAGLYDLDRALAKSSNSYFIEQGLKPGVLARIITLGQRLHLGEKTGLLPGQETKGVFPTPEETINWGDGTTANLSIGQGPIEVTPLQMAVMTAAVANGGRVLAPRLVSRVQAYGADQPSQVYPAGEIRDNLGVSRHSLDLVREAMVHDVEDASGTGHPAQIPGFRIGGKTGTAQVEKNGHIARGAQITWFVSFAPYENPRYAVVVMVEGGASGGGTCAPMARQIYQALRDRETQRERKVTPKVGMLGQIP